MPKPINSNETPLLIWVLAVAMLTAGSIGSCRLGVIGFVEGSNTLIWGGRRGGIASRTSKTFVGTAATVVSTVQLVLGISLLPLGTLGVWALRERQRRGNFSGLPGWLNWMLLAAFTTAILALNFLLFGTFLLG